MFHPLARLRQLPTGLRQRALIWGLVFGVGAVSHLGDLIDGGLSVYAWAPRAVELFLLVVALVDVGVVLLIGLLRRVGLILGAVAILTEVAVNWWALTNDAAPADLPGIGPLGLTLLALVVFVAAPGLWSGLSVAPLREPAASAPSWDRG